MESTFIEYIKAYLKPVITGIVQEINGSTNTPPPYFFQRLFRKQFSVTGKWESLYVNDVPVAADYVSMDSPLPIKSRAGQGSASGSIAKMGMRKQLNETQLTELDTMAALNVDESDIVAKLFQDDKACITGIYEKLEYVTLQGLSNGDVLLTDAGNVGVGIRIKYVPDANRTGVDVVWSDTTSTPLTFLSNYNTNTAIPAGNKVTRWLVDRATLNNIRKTDEAKNLFAVSQGNFSDTRLVPSVDQLNNLVRAEFGFVFEIVEKVVNLERDGTKTPTNPWKAGAVVGLTADIIGSLFYATLAEDNRHKVGVEYQKADDYILVSKEYQTEPALAEVTKSQARVVPVVSQPIYLVDSTTVQA